MGQTHTYTITSTWNGGRSGQGNIEATDTQLPFSIPTNLGGPGIGSNPEELLVSAAAGCYLITLSILLENRKIPYASLTLESKVHVENDHGLRVDSIEHFPTLVFEEPVNVEQIEEMVIHAEHTCMVSTALRGNVGVTVRPTIQVRASSM